MFRYSHLVMSFLLLHYCLKVSELYFSKVTRYFYYVTLQHC